ncbi:septation ring formation regulator EzrA [Anaerobacillus sp. MEB173]|uniref:septation ring formation regulator EzrA n=1 Tax=Anaerobacillus sp. MEB173 TaxID=3383345 RepID=UPI003F8DD223
MSLYIYGIILLFVIVIAYGAYARKKVYKEVDRLEAWKIEIMNRPITDEISKVKSLKMSGQTEEKFESWRSEWDDIVTVQLPDIEEYLFDIEELANKYRFIKGKDLVSKVHQRLEEIESRLKEMAQEIDELVHSEEQNRSDIVTIRNLHKELKKKFSSKKATLGETAESFEHKLTEVSSKFEVFDQLTGEGNYFQARELLLVMQEQLEDTEAKMELIPQLIAQLDTVLPGQLSDLASGMKEMEEDGYVLEEFELEKDIEAIYEQLTEVRKHFEAVELEQMEQKLGEITQEIDRLYDTLEGEVFAKQFVQDELGNLHTALTRTHGEMVELKEEAETVRLSYRIAEQEMQLHKTLEKQLKELAKKFSVIDDVTINQKHSYTTIRELIEEFQQQLLEIRETTQKCKQNLTTLRKDELKAKEQLKQLHKKIMDGKSLVHKSNIPGLPQKVMLKHDEALQKLDDVNQQLDEIPLAIDTVNEKLQDALENVEEAYQLIVETIEKSTTAEYIIQYGNRYRSGNQALHVELLEAEYQFRSYDYDQAIEIAVKALEKIEPNILEKINKMITEKHTLTLK